MWIKAGDAYRSQSDPPSIDRIKAMLKQCRERGGDGCNCDGECKVNKILEKEASDAVSDPRLQQ